LERTEGTAYVVHSVRWWVAPIEKYSFLNPYPIERAPLVYNITNIK